MEKLKSELIRLVDEPVPKDTSLSIDQVNSTKLEDKQSSYVDDWEFDEVW